MAMLEAVSDTTGLPKSSDLQQEKIVIMAHSSDSATFSIKDEDHTLGNSLRYILTKNPNVEFCGYSIPHPSEFKIHLRIQTDGTISAVDALYKGLDDLTQVCCQIEDEFKEAMEKYKS